MITKRFSFKLAVLFSMFVMFMLPSATWHETAHAQGPDVGAQLVDVPATDITLGFAPTNVIIPEGSTAKNVINLSTGATGGNIYSIYAEISFPRDSFQLVSVPAKPVTFVSPATTVPDVRFDIITPVGLANQTGTFAVKITCNCMLANNTIYSILEFEWKAVGAQCGPSTTPNVLITRAEIEQPQFTPYNIPASQRTNSSILSTAFPVSNVFIGTLPNDPGRYDKKIGDTFATDVRIDKACGVTRFQAQIPYDSSIVEASAVIPSVLFGNNAINNSTIANNIVKIDIETTTPFNSGGILAQINWKGLKGGKSPQDFTTGSIHLFDSAKAEITSPAPTSNNGGIIYIAKKEIVINSDAAMTASPSVTLTISNGGNANLASMRIWNDGDAQPETWETLQPTKSWTLKTGAAGTRRVNLKFLNSSNQEIATVYYDDINLTTDYNGTEPTPTQTPTGTLTPIATTVPTATVVPSATPVTPVPTTVPSATPVTPAPTTVPSATPVTPVPTATTPATGDMLTGRVRLQGRGSHTDVKVYADFVPCNVMTPGAANEIPVTLVNNIPAGSTIASDATFNMQNKGYQCLMLVRPGHFSAQRNNPSGNVGYVELPGGDFIVNNSNAINIFDLTYAADKYGKADPLVDFNGVGNVDILDLSVVAANYGRTGPISW